MSVLGVRDRTYHQRHGSWKKEWRCGSPEPQALKQGVESLLVLTGTSAFPTKKWGPNNENNPKVSLPPTSP